MTERSEPAFDRSPLTGAVVGLAAGLIASFVMDRFQAGIGALSTSDKPKGEPATEKAADAIARRVVGHDVVGASKAAAGQVVHYTLGAALGAAYGAMAELRPAVTTGFGCMFGAGVAGVLDEAAVPAVGLGSAPWNTSAYTHAYGLVSHLVFGTALEGSRRVLRALLR